VYWKLALVGSVLLVPVWLTARSLRSPPVAVAVLLSPLLAVAVLSLPLDCGGVVVAMFGYFPRHPLTWRGPTPPRPRIRFAASDPTTPSISFALAAVQLHKQPLTFDDRPNRRVR
jgi:hypothetical protein